MSALHVSRTQLLIEGSIIYKPAQKSLYLTAGILCSNVAYIIYNVPTTGQHSVIVLLTKSAHMDLAYIICLHVCMRSSTVLYYGSVISLYIYIYIYTQLSWYGGFHPHNRFVAPPLSHMFTDFLVWKINQYNSEEP